MPRKRTESVKEALEALGRESRREHYVLRLYVAGTTPRSQEAIRNVTAICEEHLAGRYTLEVVDVYQRPGLVEGEQILAAPTLIKQLPTPLRRLIGSMADKEKVLVGLDLRPRHS
jgi:circadian clock protein KaiB